MQILKGKDLPERAYLSRYLDNEYEAVRVTGLGSGQTLVVDVTLDGGYQHPDQPAVAGWSGKAGREGVHSALLTIVKGADFNLVFEPTISYGIGSELRNSRGRGLTIADCNDFEVSDAYVRGARTAGISLHNCSMFALSRPVTVDTGNYQDAKAEGPNWPGSIKFENCHNYTMDGAMSIDHLGNGITATESIDGLWYDPFCYAVNGANIYINASPNHGIRGGIAAGGNRGGGTLAGNPTNRPPGYVVNSEEENEGVSEGVAFRDCRALDTGWGLGFWGNEKKAGIVIQNAAMIDGILVSEGGIKIHPNANVQNFDDSGTLIIPMASMEAAPLAALRGQADRLAVAVRDHEPWDVIDALRAGLVAGFAGLRVVAEPDQRAALRAWVAEADELVPQLGEWLARGRGLVG